MKKKVFLSFAALTAAFTMNAQSKLPAFKENLDLGQSIKADFVKPAKQRTATASDVSYYYWENNSRVTKEINDHLAANPVQVQIDAAGNKGPLEFDTLVLYGYKSAQKTTSTGATYWQKLVQGIPTTAPIKLTKVRFLGMSNKTTAKSTSNIVVKVYDKDMVNVLATKNMSIANTWGWQDVVFDAPVATSDTVLVTFEMATATDIFQVAHSHNYFKGGNLKTMFTNVADAAYPTFNSALPFIGDAAILATNVNQGSILGLIKQNFDFFIIPSFTYDFTTQFTASKTTVVEGDTVNFSTTPNALALNPVLNYIRWDELANGTTEPLYTAFKIGNEVKASSVWNKSHIFATPGSFRVVASGIMAPWTAASLLEDSTVFNITVTSKCVKPAVPTFTGAAAVCVGATINLTPSATGGTWTSSAATKATVTAGAVKGIAAGTATISYTVGTTGCSSTGTKVITVEAKPVVTISGPAKICWNGRTMMRASVAGGVWGVENSALLIASPQGLFRNSVKPATDNFKSGVNYTVKSKLGACSAKVVKAVYVRNVTAPSITVTAAPSTTVKVNATVTATAATTIAAVGTWSSTNTLVSATANTTNTKTAAVKGLKVGSGANVVYFADDAATGCRQAGYLAFNVTAAASMVDANQGSISSTTGVSVYPNPSNGVVTFENIAGAKSISLVDMTGRTVKTVAVNADRMTVNFSGVQNGKYLVQVAGENVNEVRSIVIE
jgi:hypothetical protein